MPVLFNLLWLTELLILKDFRNWLFLGMLDMDQAHSSWRGGYPKSECPCWDLPVWMFKCHQYRFGRTNRTCWNMALLSQFKVVSVYSNSHRNKKERYTCFVIDMLYSERKKNEILQLDGSAVMFIMPLQPMS